MKRATSFFAVISCLYLLGAGSAEAAGTICDQVGPDMFVVDGMLDDWREIRSFRAGGDDPGFDLRCAYDDKNLYLSVDVRDKSMRRTGKKQDHLKINLSAGGKRASLTAYPGYKGTPPKRRWGGGKVPRWVEVEDTKQPRGWSLELAMPLARLDGWGQKSPALCAEVAYADADWDGEGIHPARFAGTLHFSWARGVYRGFLRAAHLSRSDIRLDTLAEVTGTPGRERVIAGGSVIGVLSDGFTYLTLPVSSPKDVLAVKVVDLAGDGTSALLAHYRQRGNGGSRDIVAVWYLEGSNFSQILAVEVRKQLGDRVLSNRWYLTPKGKFRKGKHDKRGYDLVVEAGDVEGWDEDNYNEIPAPDVKPILQPWEDKTSAVYFFHGNVVEGGDPKVER